MAVMEGFAVVFLVATVTSDPQSIESYAKLAEV
jgi:hypothetical protein